MRNDLILSKLQTQLRFHPHPIIACIDFDGTLYTAGKTMWKAPYYNRKTSSLFRKSHIPFVIVTGRADWNALAEAELQVFGMTKPDAVITGAGSMVYYRNEQGVLEQDIDRLAMLETCTFIWRDNKGREKKERWNKEHIITITQTHQYASYLRLSTDDDNVFVVRFSVRNVPIDILEHIKSELKTIFPEGIKILIAEKLLQKNTVDIYSGDILLVPFLAGKDSAIAYILERYALLLPLSAEKIRKAEAGTSKLQAYIFGDSSIDIKMLAMEEDSKHYFLSQYGVHLTPRAEKILKKVQLKNPHLQLVADDGPKVIFHTFRKILTQSHFSPAQNSYARKLIAPFEKIINKTVYPHLSANELSFKGLSLVIKGINVIYDSQGKKKQNSKGLRYYLLGMSMDLFDGMRARSSQRRFLHDNELDVDGQLIDVFCDRAKEFYQLYKRSFFVILTETKNPAQNQQTLNQAYQTLLAAMSCVLPSAARAQVEMENTIVKENDEHGGSMFKRSRRLLLSLLYDTSGKKQKSFAIDKNIYETNMATFTHRLSFLPRSNPVNTLHKLDLPQLSDFQKKALERFLLLVQLLQEENQIIVKALKEYPQLLENYQTFQKNIAQYLEIDVKIMRKANNIAFPSLSLQQYLHI